MKKSTRKPAARETDNAYFLKILLYFVFGTIWIKYNGRPVLPIGLLAGVFFIRSDHFNIDRKVEYAILIVAVLMGLMGFGLFLGFWGPGPGGA
jgi:hypothetical protein